MDSTSYGRWFGAAIAISGLALALPAQGLVLPPSHLGRAGTGATNVPFGRSTPQRVQLVYDASLFAGATTFSTIDFRIDEGLSAAGKRVELEVRASSLGRSVTEVQPQFAANRGPDEAVVRVRALVDLPAAGSGASPNPFDVAIPLDAGFTFDPATGGALVLELVVWGQAPGAYPLDTSYVCASPGLGYGPAGCGPAGGPTLKADSPTSQLTWGGALTLRIHDAAPGASVVFVLGFLEGGAWNGITLPFDLSVVGATGCWLAVDVTAGIPSLADATGAAFHGLLLPSRPELVGEWVRFQGLAIQPGANPLGVVTSQAFKIQVCGWEPVARVYAAGTSSATGLHEVGVAPVVRLR